MDHFPPILAIFYSEFDPIQGPKILFDTPEGFTSSAETSIDFDSLAEYIIPKPSLCNSLVTISTEKYNIMGYPIQITNQKYKRNALYFNLCFVLDKSLESSCYDQIVCKIARVLTFLELESELLSSDNKDSLVNIIAQIKDDLNSYQECQIIINEFNALDLKLFIAYNDPEDVRDFHVPVFVVDLSRVIDQYWDLTIQRVVKFINGINSIDKISKSSEVDIEYVKLAVQHLIYYGCVKLIDIFQFSNIYSVSNSLSLFLNSLEHQLECLNFITKPGLKPLPISTVILLYCSFKGQVTLLDWISENPMIFNRIDIRYCFFKM